VPAGVVTAEVDEVWHFLEEKPTTLRAWRAYGLHARRTVAPVSFADIPPGDRCAMVLGGRDDATLRRLPGKVGTAGRTFVTDDWEGCRRVVLPGQVLTGKDLTFPTGQDHSNVRHCLARFRRRTKVVSKCQTMVDLSLRLLHHLQHPANYAAYAKTSASVLG